MEANAQANQGNEQVTKRPSNENVPSKGGFLAGQGGFEGLTAEHLQAAD